MSRTANSTWRDAAATLARDPAASVSLPAEDPQEVAPAPAPDRLFARPCAVPQVLWHAERLRELSGDADPVERAPERTLERNLERAWHARWLWYHLAPDDPESAPRVSVVIPVYNRAEQVARAVASVLAQDWPSIEAVVVDDASDDDPAAALAGFGDRLILHRLPRNGGVSAARNAALALAKGELVQLLDSDNELPPGAISAKVAAFAAVPDALLCFSGFKRISLPGVEEDQSFMPVIGAEPFCATLDPAVGLIHRFPFPTSSVLIARHRLLGAGSFDERLRRHEDRLLAQRLGLLDTKCIAIDAPLVITRQTPGSLSQVPDRDGDAALAALIFLNEMLPHPEHWDLAAFVLGQCFWEHQWQNANSRGDSAFETEAARLFAWLDAFAEGKVLPQLSPRPLAAEFMAMLEQNGALTPGAPEASGNFGPPFLARLQRMLAARPPSAADLELWRGSHNPAQNRPAFLEIFAVLSEELRHGQPWVPLGELDRRPFRSLAHPWRRRWKRLAQLSRLLGERPARGLARWHG